jgi:hypothetical protein
MLSWLIVCALRSGSKHYEKYFTTTFECLDPLLRSAHSGHGRRAGGAARSPEPGGFGGSLNIPLAPLQTVHRAAVSEVLLPLRRPDPADRVRLCATCTCRLPRPPATRWAAARAGAGSSPQLRAVRDLGSPPRSRRAGLRRDPDDRPDASFSKGRVMENPALRIVWPDARGRRGAYGPFYECRWPAPITDSARNVT